MSRITVCAATLALAGASLPALAHVGLEPAQAVANSTVNVAFRIGHGCGESPTTAIKVRIPAGVTGVQPQPKPGWTLAVTKGPLPGVVAAAGAAVAEGVIQVDWTGGKLPVEFFDTFVLRMKMPNAPGTTLYFPIVQECENGAHRWIEPTVPGQPEPPEPMPGVRLTAP
ncbi:MAG: DUF1775 domain-containing protein [Alphaproteobacteria bacterium]|nr:DUF1775 domain-containing protein [Alphaproteobacteria bacterium]